MPARWADSLPSAGVAIAAGGIIHEFIPFIESSVNITNRLSILVTILFDDPIIGLIEVAVNPGAHIQV